MAGKAAPPIPSSGSINQPSQDAPGGPETRARQAAVGRLSGLLQGKRRRKAGIWPGDPAIRFQFQVLRNDESQAAQAQAFKHFRETLELDPTLALNLQTFRDEQATQILALAMRDPEDPDLPLASNAADLRAATDQDDRASLIAQYVDLMDETDPDPGTLSPEVEREILALVKKKDGSGLAAFGSRTLASFLLSMGSPRSTSPTDS